MRAKKGLDKEKNSAYNIHTEIRKKRAGIAQLVEHHLAKVDVAGSSPVSRSIFMAA